MNRNLRIIILLLAVFIVGCNSAITQPNVEYLCHLDEVETRFDNCNWGNLSSAQNNQYRSLMEQSFKSIDANYVAPKWDGNEYYGEISFCLDRNGLVDSATMKKASGSIELDAAFMKALKNTSSINVPNDKCLADKFYFTQKLMYFDETDMEK